MFLLGIPSASAHDPLQGSSPAADETISAELTEVTLTFGNAPLEGAPSAIQVSDPSGNRVDDDSVVATDQSLTVGVTLPVTGLYSVLWQTVSSDGHTISGEFAFTYAGPVPAPTLESSANATSPAPSSAPEAPDDAANTSEVAEETALPVPLIIVVIALVLAAIVIVAMRALRGKRST